MKISAVNSCGQVNRNVQNSKNNVHFNGLLIHQRHSYDSYEYDGSPSSYNINGHYVGDTSDEYYTYYPFKDESEAEISKALRDNNYSSTSDCGGYIGTVSCSTERGKTLPFTKREWNSYTKSMKEKIEDLL